MVTSINIEGISSLKEVLLADMCKQTDCDVLLVQETHRGSTRNRPKIAGMKMIVERPHDQYGSAIFVKPGVNVISTSMTESDNIELLTIRTPNFSVTSVYKPPDAKFKFANLNDLRQQNINFVIGDFNCKSSAWGYNETDENGAELEKWAETNELQIIHDPKLPPSFHSGRWRRGYNPDNIFVSARVASQCEKSVGEPIPRTQHRPIRCSVSAVVKPENVPFRRRFNFKKANWSKFSKDLDAEIVRIAPQPERYDTFIELVKKISKRNIPRGCRTEYIPALPGDARPLLARYQELHDADPFAEETIETGEMLMSTIAEDRAAKWCNMLESLDMKVNSRRAWKTLKNLSGDTVKPVQNFIPVTSDQVATQLLLNGKTGSRKPKEHFNRDMNHENNYLGTPFSMTELEAGIKMMKPNRAAGVDDLRAEQVKKFGPQTLHWLLNLFNACVTQLKIPKEWRKARVVALLKPGKEPTEPKNFRPVSLLCQLFKLLERLILNRISEALNAKIIEQQAGFRPGKSCCGQILNLTQHIEDGFERRKITGVTFIDLTAAYDTVNHRRLLRKLYDMTKDYRLTSVIGLFLQNRRFYVSLQNKNSRWRVQKNGLPQGSVLSPVLYNVYTNDQPIPENIRQFIYADDTAVAAQGTEFTEVEEKLEVALEELATYYQNNYLKPNPSKTQVCAFHLKNAEARRELEINWRGERLEHCPTPRYLGVTLDRTLSFRQHCINTKGKVSARNNILRKLTSKAWGAQPETLRSSALALCVSTAEYAAPVWAASTHAKHVDVAINETARIVTGCLKPTPVESLYPLIGVAPPSVRRAVATDAERTKQETDARHPLYHHEPANRRLRSRKSFMARSHTLEGSQENNRIARWTQQLAAQEPPKEELAPGKHLPFAIWKSLNRLRTGVARCKTNLLKWGMLPESDDVLCSCGQIQDMNHLLICPRLEERCTHEDLFLCNEKAIAAASFWKDIV